jgi:hypothetical protein
MPLGLWLTQTTSEDILATPLQIPPFSDDGGMILSSGFGVCEMILTSKLEIRAEALRAVSGKIICNGCGNQYKAHK